MNQNDPMKDNSAGNDRDRDAYGYRPSDGQGYINPDGSHGYVYYPNDSLAEKKKRRYRSAVIALSVIMITLLLSVCCLVGVYMAIQMPIGYHPAVDGAETESSLGTSGGLVIGNNEPSESKDTVASEEYAFEETLQERPVGSPPAVNDSATDDTTPPLASINKLPPKREDRDGDGLAEIEIDENGQVLTSAGNTPLTVATVVNRVAASVVEITTETVVQSGRVNQYVTSGAGSGVIVSKEGFIVTNYHVIEGANSVTVRLNNGREFVAKAVGVDKKTDIAVLWIDAADYELTVATLGSSFDLVVGEGILSIGNPLGSLGGTVTEGMVSATARRIGVEGTVMTLLQVSAPINPGNSGGGLFNLAGELVGIVNAKISDTEIEGIGFAIPVDTAYDIILEIIEHGYVKGRPALGFKVVDVTSVDVAIRYFDTFYPGVYVYDRGHDTVRYGDLILSVDGVKIQTAAELHEMIERKSVGDTVELVIYRNREKRSVTLTVGEQMP